MTAVASLTHIRVIVDNTLPIAKIKHIALKISRLFYWSVS